MTNLLKLPTWADKKKIYAVIETPRGSTCKLDFEPKLRIFTLAKPLMTGLAYPYDWGFIPSTMAEDGDPLDVLVFLDAAVPPGCVTTARLHRAARRPRAGTHAREAGAKACKAGK